MRRRALVPAVYFFIVFVLVASALFLVAEKSLKFITQKQEDISKVNFRNGGFMEKKAPKETMEEGGGRSLHLKIQNAKYKNGGNILEIVLENGGGKIVNTSKVSFLFYLANGKVYQLYPERSSIENCEVLYPRDSCKLSVSTAKVLEELGESNYRAKIVPVLSLGRGGTIIFGAGFFVIEG